MPRTAIASLALLALLCACGGKEDVDAAAEANRIWNERCVTCHGSDGSGKGPGAGALAVKPRSFQDPSWQASVDDARIEKVIVEGGASVGLDPAMPPNADLRDKPAVRAALVDMIRRMVK